MNLNTDEVKPSEGKAKLSHQLPFLSIFDPPTRNVNLLPMVRWYLPEKVWLWNEDKALKNSFNKTVAIPLEDETNY